jgi:hypothetical protein
MAEKVKSLEKHLEIVSQITLKILESLQAKIRNLDKWRNKEKNVPNSLPAVKAYDIRLHTLATNECQQRASKLEEKVRQSLARMMDVYEKSIYDVQIYLQWPEINFKDKYPISFAFFQEPEDKYEMTKVEVQAKEVISKDDIQEFFVKPSMEFSHYTAFVHEFVVDMEKFKEFNLTLNVKKEQRILTQCEAWSKYFQNKGR